MFKIFESNSDFEIRDEKGELFAPITDDEVNIYEIIKKLDAKIYQELGSGGNHFHYLFLINDFVVGFHPATGDITISEKKYTIQDYKDEVIANDFFEDENGLMDYTIPSSEFSYTEKPFIETDYLVDQIKNWELYKNTGKYKI